MNALKDFMWLIGFSLASVGLLMAFRAKTDLPMNTRELIAIGALFTSVFVYILKKYSVNMLTIIYGIFVSIVLLTVIDVYPSIHYLIPYFIVLMTTLMFHYLNDKRNNKRHENASKEDI